MSQHQIYVADKIFDGKIWHHDAALLVEEGKVIAIQPKSAIANGEITATYTGMLVPGFVDLQVNGGGGLLFNEHPTIEGLKTICAAQVQFGVTALLPTLITDVPAVVTSALDAGIAASEQGVAGFEGLHMEGPHLSIARKGTHFPGYIRHMTEDDLQQLIAAKSNIPTIIATIAVESVTPEQVTRLAAAGISVSLGHTDASFSAALDYIEAGATLATHLYNAMSQMGNREPGLVGAVLQSGVYAGLIADGIHVHPDMIKIALNAKQGGGHIYLVTDAMSVTGTDLQSFTLNGREIFRKDGSLRLADGTLAGADLSMIDAIKYMINTIGVDFDEVLRMATLYPAQAIQRENTIGVLAQGSDASFVVLDDALDIQSVWIKGNESYQA